MHVRAHVAKACRNHAALRCACRCRHTSAHHVTRPQARPCSTVARAKTRVDLLRDMLVRSWPWGSAVSYTAEVMLCTIVACVGAQQFLSILGTHFPGFVWMLPCMVRAVANYWRHCHCSTCPLKLLIKWCCCQYSPNLHPVWVHRLFLALLPIFPPIPMILAFFCCVWPDFHPLGFPVEMGRWNDI